MIWLYWGNRTMSFLRYMSLHSACSLNDSVTLIVPRDPIGKYSDQWVEATDTTTYSGPDYTSMAVRLPNLRIVFLDELYPGIAALGAPEIHTSDLLGWRLLQQFGGTVADMDIVFVRPVPRIQADAQWTRFAGRPQPAYTPVSFLQGRAGAFWGEIYNAALASYDPCRYESCGAEHLVGRRPSSWRRLPSRTVFPWSERQEEWPDYHRMTFEEVHPLPDNTIGIHWYAGANTERNNQITHENWQCPKTTLSVAIGKTFHGFD